MWDYTFCAHNQFVFEFYLCVCLYLFFAYRMSLTVFPVPVVGLFMYCRWDGKYVKKKALVSGLYRQFSYTLLFLRVWYKFKVFHCKASLKSETVPMEC